MQTSPLRTLLGPWNLAELVLGKTTCLSVTFTDEHLTLKHTTASWSRGCEKKNSRFMPPAQTTTSPMIAKFTPQPPLSARAHPNGRRLAEDHHPVITCLALTLTARSLSSVTNACLCTMLQQNVIILTMDRVRTTPCCQITYRPLTERQSRLQPVALTPSLRPLHIARTRSTPGHTISYASR